MLRFAIVLISLVAAYATTVSAQNYYTPYGRAPAYAPPRPAIDEPAALVQHGIAKLQAFQTQNRGRANPALAAAFVEQTIAPYFDFAAMTRWALGSRGGRLSGAQTARAVAQLKSHFLAAVARQVGDHRTTRITVHASRRGRNEIIVPATVQPRDGRPSLLEFRFFHGPASWRIFDVKAGGQSAVVFYRGYFARLMRRGGRR